MAGASAEANVRVCLQPIDHRSQVANVLAAAIVRAGVQPAHWRSRVAGVPTAAIVRVRIRQPIAGIVWPSSLQCVTRDEKRLL